MSAELEQPKKPGLGSVAVSEHVAIGKRFVEFCEVLDSQSDSVRSSIVTWMLEKEKQHCIATETRSGVSHREAPKAPNNGRIALPVSIMRTLVNKPETWSDKDFRKPFTWFVCWRDSIKPDQLKSEWQNFECSHRCTSKSNCWSASCLTWECKSVNQSRGQDFCTKVCTHCGSRLCVCQSLHDPPCL